MSQHSTLRAVLAMVFVAALSGPARSADSPPEFQLVPGDTLGFVHVRVSDLWKVSAFQEYRDVLKLAGPKAIAAIDDQFAPALSTFERATVFFMKAPNPGDEPLPVGVLTFSAPFESARVLRCTLPDAKRTTVDRKVLYESATAKVAVYFPDAKTIVIAPIDAMKIYLRRVPTPATAMQSAFELAGSGRPFVVAVNLQQLPIPAQAKAQVPPDFQPLVRAKFLTITTTNDAEPRLDLRAMFPTADEATAGEKAIRQAAELARAMLPAARAELEKLLFAKSPVGGEPRPIDQFPDALGAVFGLGTVNYVDKLLAEPPVKTVGSSVVVTLPIPSLGQSPVVYPVLIGMLLPAVQKVREAAARAGSVNNLKLIGLGMNNYHDTYMRFPSASITDDDGKPLLSWRVEILPYIDQHALYRKFKRDEPWDSEHNKKLIPLMPKVYADPRMGNEPGLTTYKSFVGKGTAIQPGGKASHNFTTITDGTALTLLVGSAGDPVTWTKPDDFAFDPDKPLPDLSKPFGNLLAVFCDGHVQIVPTNDGKLLKALMTAAGGEVIALP